MSNPATPFFRLELRRFWRRALVVGLYLGYSGLLTFWVLVPAAGPLAWVAPQITITVSMLMLVIALILYFATGGVADVGDHDFNPEAHPRALDERQEGVRNRAYAFAYLILGPSLIVLIFTAQQLAPLWLAAGGLFLYTVLPTAVIAWLEPDPPGENEIPTTVLRKERV